MQLGFVTERWPATSGRGQCMRLPGRAARAACRGNAATAGAPGPPWIAEQDTGHGTTIDVIVDKKEGLWFYEIKTSTCIRSCIREGLTQLMEYAFWSSGLTATKLIIVGEVGTDHAARKYLETLRTTFHIPVNYCRLDYARQKIGPEE